MLYISYHVHWSEINAYITSGFHSGIAEGRLFWDVTPFRQQIAYVSRDRIFFTVIERVLKHVCPMVNFGEKFCCYFFVSLFNSLLSLIPFARALFSFFISSKISLFFSLFIMSVLLLVFRDCWSFFSPVPLKWLHFRHYVGTVSYEAISKQFFQLAMSSALRSEISLTFLLVTEQVTGVLLFLLHGFHEKVDIHWSSWLIVANELQ